MRLYELATDYEILLNYIESIEEYSDDAGDYIADTLESINEPFEEKIINTAYVIKNMGAQEEAIQSEIRRLNKRKQTLKNSQERLKNNVMEALQRTGKDKVDGDLFSVSLRNNPESVVITNEESIPEDYLQVEYKVSKTDLKKALQAGENIEGARLTRTQSVQIR